MKKIIFLLCIFLLVFILYSSTIESLELLPLEQADINRVSLNLKLPTEVDRHSCNNGYKYCYNGDLKKKDVFGNSIDIEGSVYNYGKTYNDISYDKVYLSDFKQNESLSSSSKTRDVYYDPYNICNNNDPWHLKLPLDVINLNYENSDLSQCYSSESEASYQHDNYYYLKDTTKYPFDVKPVNPNDYTISASELKENDKVILKTDVKNIVYSVSLCSSAKPLYANDECHPITDTVMDNKCNINFPYIVDGSCVDYDTAIANVKDGCSQKKPYKYNGVCYASIDQVYTDKTEYIFDYIQNGLCYLKDNDIGLSCEDIYRIKDFDISMLYNPITNNYVGQLKYGDYSYIDCSGTLTKCMKDFPYEKNTKGELVPIFSINKNKTIKLPEYTKPEQYKEPPISKYINPYNSDIQSNLFIQCKSDYSTIPEENMCPKELPICKGNVNQLGFCNESIYSSQNLGSYNIHMLSCKNNYSSIPNEDMCPYNLPYCEDNICKESSLFYNR